MRGSETEFDWQGALVTLVVALIVVFVGLQTMMTITDEQIEQMEAMEEDTTVCAGVFGCGQSFGLAPPMMLTVIIAIIVVYLYGLRHESPTNPDVEDAKQLYIQGEITLLDLEERLEDDIDEDDL